MEGDEKRRRGAWELFVALMFLGLGLGMLFGQAGAGVIIGMGVGFLASAFVGRIERRYTLVIPRSVGSIAIATIGIGFILLGLELLALVPLPREIARYVAGLAAILFGIWLLFFGTKHDIEKF